MLVDFINQWQASSRESRHGRGPARSGTWGLVLWLGLASACNHRKEDECAAVQSRVLEEVRIVDGFHDHVHDVKAIGRQARRLSELSAELKDLSIRDAQLRLAVERYHTSIAHLAEVWAQVVGMRQEGLEDGGLFAGTSKEGLVKLSTMMSDVNDARSVISEVCGAR